MATRSPTQPVVVVTGIVYALLGIVLAGGGLWLMTLGGSAYYLFGGLGILATGALLVAGRQSALWVYAAVLIGTLIWAVSEIGFDWWPLAARGDIIYPLGLWLLTPWITRNLSSDSSASRATLPLWGAAVAGAIVLVIGLASSYHSIDGVIGNADQQLAQQDVSAQPDEDWHAYGRTQFGQRYSPLKQITPDNVTDLKVAWTFRTGDLPGKNDPGETTFEVTPIKVRDTVYLCSPHQRLFAVDAKTGTLRWSYDPKVQDNPTFQHLTCRGVSYHETAAGDLNTDGTPAPTDCPRTIFLPVNDGRMVAVNADTGKACESFADHGTLNLLDGMGVKTAGFYEPTSPPVVSAKILVVAGAVIDNYSTAEPSGVVRGFDIHTGKLIWAWDPGAADENALPSATHTYTNNSPNSWMTASYDAKLGLVYLPMGVQTPDIWGGNRSALSERYSSALVALDINSGKRVWSYQTVHHDLWDMDLPSQPTLVDMPTADGTVPAILQPAKTGNLFVLDRRTGKPIVPAPERPVPQGAAPGDRLAPTQPFSELTFRPEAKLTGADMWGATIFDQLSCRILFHQLRYEGTFTPPSLQGTLVFPGNLGMFEWGGIAVDPVRQIAIANPMAVPFVSKLLPRGPDNPTAPNSAHPSGSEIGVQPMYGVPYGVVLHPFLSPIGLPCFRPPWGYIAGIDLKTRKIAWMHPNGTIRDSSPVPIPIKMGVPMLGGPLTTAGGVSFLTSTADYFIRAYDVTTGKQLWEDRLPAGGQSTPMSYAIDGKQYVVTAAGGHGSFGTKVGDYVIAYALPTAPRSNMARNAKLSSITLVTGALLLSTAASAQTKATLAKGADIEKVDSQTAPPPTGLTGDWGGLRTQLHDAGIDAAASYVSETGGNFEGGSRQIVRETGQFALGFTADMAALAGLDGGTMQFTLTDRRGEDLGAAANLGVLQQVQEVYGRGQTERVTQLWYEQRFDQDTWALKLGRTTVGEDFDNFPCYFMNLSLCGSVPGNLAGSYWYNWPISQWSGRLRYNDGNRYIQGAVYEANPRNLDNSFSFGHYSGATGVLVPFEIGWDPDPTATGGIGIYKIGGWYSNAPGNDLILGIDGKPRILTGAPALQRHDRYGGWVSVQQQVFGEAANGKFLNGGAFFLNVTITDHRTSAIDDQIAAGFWWKGIIPALPDDVLGIGIARTHVNSLVAYGDSLVGAPRPDAEYAGEIYFSLHPFDRIEMRPNFQLIHNPGGIKSAQDVGVLGLKAGITL